MASEYDTINCKEDAIKLSEDALLSKSKINFTTVSKYYF